MERGRKTLEKKYSDSLRKAWENRVTVQYGVQIFTNADVDWILEEAEDFELSIEELLAEYEWWLQADPSSRFS